LDCATLIVSGPQPLMHKEDGGAYAELVFFSLII